MRSSVVHWRERARVRAGVVPEARGPAIGAWDHLVADSSGIFLIIIVRELCVAAPGIRLLDF